MDDFEFENERAWYVVQSYSGMEQAAKRNLERRIVSMNMQDYIFRVLIPETTRYEKKKNGEMKEIVEKVFPGYIFVDMIVTDESWFVVRNTPMVTGFLGSSGGGAKPVPLPNEEIIPILRTCGITVEFNIDFKVGDQVRVKASATTYATGQIIASFVKNSTYEIIRVNGNQLLLSKIVSWMNEVDVEKVSADNQISVATDSSFLVEIICDELNIRQKADFNSKVVGTVKRGEVYTILQEENGLGKLKSGVGYISLNSKYVKRK